jgi:hypothetical protein
MSAVALAQQTATAPPPEPAPAPAAPATAFTYKGFSASGYLDTYYINNLNDPSNPRVSAGQAFNYTSDKLSLSSATGTFMLDPKPVGFRMDVGWGRTYDSFYASEPRKTDQMRYLLNAYVTLKPESWKGFQMDFGKFVTSAGAEVTEAHLNWNYSRSLLFNYGPFFHFGVRTSMPVTKNWTAGVQLVQGWNVVQDNNKGKTLGFTANGTFSKFTWANTFYTGQENTNLGGQRNYYDTVLLFTPSSKVAAYVNFDVGRNNIPGASAANWVVLAGAAKITVNKYLAITPRMEFFNDADGLLTGVPQNMKEFTLTGETKMNDSFIWRFEYRRDWSDKPYYADGPISFAKKNQNLLMAGFMWVVKPGMFKGQ